MFIDYVGLLLLNMAAGFFILAGYVHKGIDDPDQSKWALGFGMSGFIALVFGIHMCTTWPLPMAFNVAYGEMSVLLGVILFAAALGMWKGWNLTIVAVYAFFAGIGAIVLGARIINLRVTQQPMLSGTGFILSGLAGIFATPMLTCFKTSKSCRLLAVVVLVGAGVIWAVTGYPEYWVHMKVFGKWIPLTMRGMAGK